MAPPRVDAGLRFAASYEPEPNTGCWLWARGLTSRGYGQFWDHGPGMAHTWAYERFVGPRGGLLVCHTCDVKSCVNPAHLFLGTPADNTDDRDNKGRQARGTKQPQAKLDDDKVRRIRRQGGTCREVAAEYQVSKSTIIAVRAGRRWKHVEDA